MASRGINFKTKLIFTNAILLIIAIGVYSGYSTYVHQRERLEQLREDERNDNLRAVTRLGWLVENSNRLSGEQISAGDDIILALDHSCAPGSDPKLYVSKMFAPLFQDLGRDPILWTKRPELFRGCDQIETQAKPLQVIESLLPFPIPYITILYRNTASVRLVMISMSSFQTSLHSTGLLVADKKLAWTEDSPEYVLKALRDIDVSSPEMVQKLANRIEGETSIVTDLGTKGLLAHAVIRPGWELVRISYLPAILALIERSKMQALFLALGIISAALFVGRVLAKSFARSIEEFIGAADQISKGNFNINLDDRGTDEFARVRKALNHLSSEMVRMNAELVKQAQLSFELSTAGEVQKLLLPPKEIEVSSHRIHGTVTPAEYCGGDWWGYVAFDEKDGSKKILVLMLDVSGHGTGAALIAAIANGFIASIGEQIHRNPEFRLEPHEVLEMLDATLLASAKGDFLATGIALVLDPQANTLSICNAGNPKPFLIEPENSQNKTPPALISSAGTLLGMENSGPRKSEPFPWHPGSRLILFSDGILTPCVGHDSHALKLKDIRNLVQQGSRSSVAALSRQIVAAHPSSRFKAPLADDLSILILERVASP